MKICWVCRLQSPTKYVNALSANPTEWLNTLKQLSVQQPVNCLRVFHQFVGLALKGLRPICEIK